MRCSIGFALVVATAVAACDAARVTGDAFDALEGEAADATEVELPQGCCRADGDCDKVNDLALLYTCAFQAWPSPGEPGTCRSRPAAGTCWDDGDCLVDQVCKGSSFCPCDYRCGRPDALGTCKPLAGPGEDCGPEGGNCRPDLACCYPCGQPGCDWACAEPCDPAEAWCQDTGCAAYP